MRGVYEVSTYLRVHDPERLLFYTLAHPDAVGDTEDDYREEDGSVNISACLQMLLDPGSLRGCEIFGTAVEGTPP